ncbi:MAG: helix-turn-helix domain-containing protein [Solirubrobacterales bacterium]|nr:TetR/AcrR family transcriptional regulator [Solirubrobacterales bacterium]
MNPPTHTRTLSTAEERRSTLVAAALPIFAEQGYRAASTVAIAKAAGISQAYLFRLFPTKADLFVAAFDDAREQIVGLLTRAADEPGEMEPLEAMGRAYGEMLETERDLLQIQLQAQVVADEPKIVAASQRMFRDLYALASERSGAEEDELRGWFAQGMLMNVMAAVGAPELKTRWSESLCKQDD